MKKIVILTAATMMTVSGFALAGDRGQNGGGSEAHAVGVQAIDYDVVNEAAEGVRYSGEYKLKNVPNVAAPGLTTTLTETCMGSSSGGIAVAGFGASFGTTWRDSACVRRLDAREMASFGYTLAGKERMCDDELNRQAFQRAGTPCRADIPELAPVEEPALGAVDSDFDAFAWQNL